MRILDHLRALLARLRVGLRRRLLAATQPRRALPAAADAGDLDIDVDDTALARVAAAPAVTAAPTAPIAGTIDAPAVREPAAPVHRRRPPTRAILRAASSPTTSARVPTPAPAGAAASALAASVAAAPTAPLAGAPAASVAAAPAPAALVPPASAAALVPAASAAALVPAASAAALVPPAPAAPATATPAAPARARLRLVGEATRPAPTPLDPAIGAIPVRRFFARVGALHAPAAPTPWPATTVERFFTALVAPRLDLNPARAACIEAPRSVDEALGDFVWE